MGTKRPALIFSALFIVLATGIYIGSAARTGGSYFYPLDDTYIHMAMAKNFSTSGVWGIDSSGFSSTSSSILWTLFLSAAYLLAGINTWTPFVLNVLFATALVMFLWGEFRRDRMTSTGGIAALSAVALFMPLLPVVACGMEHTLHTLLALMFAMKAADILAESGNAVSRASARAVVWLAPVLMLARYESAAIISGVVILLVVRRKPGLAVKVLAWSAVPVMVYGAISKYLDWSFFPNSILLKGRLTRGGHPGAILDNLDTTWMFIRESPHLNLLMLSSLAVLLYTVHHGWPFWSKETVLTGIFLFAAVGHELSGGLGSFYRYEAYLIAIGTVSLFLFLSANYRTMSRMVKRVSFVVGMLIILIVGGRGAIAVLEIPVASRNIHDQQYQSAMFLARYYRGRAIAANDIGAINYFADIKCVDLYGLASMPVARAKLKQKYNPAMMQRIAKDAGVDIAILYEEWFRGYGGLPAEWKRAARWKIENNIVCGSDTVSFYAVEPDAYAKLIRDLREYSAFLPASVHRQVRPSKAQLE